MPNIEDASSTAETAGGIVDRDIPCASCGYNLRSLKIAGVCPECGVAVNRTVVCGIYLVPRDRPDEICSRPGDGGTRGGATGQPLIPRRAKTTEAKHLV